VPRPDHAGLTYFMGVLNDRRRRRRLLLATTKVRSALADPDVPLADALATFDVDARADAAQTIDGGGLAHDEHLMDAGDVAAEGRALASDGVQYVIDGIIPAYGMLGINVPSAKVGKTTFGHALGAAVATGTPFLNRSVTQARVLVIAAEDPPEYTAYLARHLTVPAGAMTIYRRPLRFDAAGLTAITTTAADGGYGLVLVSSWQSVVAAS
jgi:hypothetical protein